MWIVRNPDDKRLGKWERNKLVVSNQIEKPTRIVRGEEYITMGSCWWCGTRCFPLQKDTNINLGKDFDFPVGVFNIDEFKDLKWEDEPIELKVEIKRV